MIPNPTPKQRQIQLTAVHNGCDARWCEGMFGWAFHCFCEDEQHCCDQQCSMIDERSAARKAGE